LRSRTFTAHPKFDPETGEMITMGYEAKGDGTNDVCYMRFDKNGTKIDECFIKTPHAGMMHGILPYISLIRFLRHANTCRIPRHPPQLFR
jgi:carotenoid cleavage dioxygenase-like enzyme